MRFFQKNIIFVCDIASNNNIKPMSTTSKTIQSFIQKSNNNNNEWVTIQCTKNKYDKANSKGSGATNKKNHKRRTNTHERKRRRISTKEWNDKGKKKKKNYNGTGNGERRKEEKRKWRMNKSNCQSWMTSAINQLPTHSTN